MYDPQLAELIVTLEKEKEDEKYHNLSWSSYYLLVTEKKKLNSRFILLRTFILIQCPLSMPSFMIWRR